MILLHLHAQIYYSLTMMMMIVNFFPRIGTNRIFQWVPNILYSSYCSTCGINHLHFFCFMGWGSTYECWKRLRHFEHRKSFSGNPTSPHIQHTRRRGGETFFHIRTPF
ncbi:hypothetical protein ACJIZ3_007833 [Penstemon smallii]|uniref:Uncharacterized protein n=1 Tax=Penstemon smallii TaxID=265156 RepID=A0ABD3T8D9_9LAMI